MHNDQHNYISIRHTDCVKKQNLIASILQKNLLKSMQMHCSVWKLNKQDIHWPMGGTTGEKKSFSQDIEFHLLVMFCSLQFMFTQYKVP